MGRSTWDSRDAAGNLGVQRVCVCVFQKITKVHIFTGHMLKLRIVSMNELSQGGQCSSCVWNPCVTFNVASVEIFQNHIHDCPTSPTKLKTYNRQQIANLVSAWVTRRAWAWPCLPCRALTCLASPCLSGLFGPPPPKMSLLKILEDNRFQISSRHLRTIRTSEAKFISKHSEF